MSDPQGAKEAFARTEIANYDSGLIRSADNVADALTIVIKKANSIVRTLTTGYLHHPIAHDLKDGELLAGNMTPAPWSAGSSMKRKIPQCAEARLSSTS